MIPYDQAREDDIDDVWLGCRLVNPYCPDDLCLLEHLHEGYHLLSTMYEPSPVSDVMFLWDGGPVTKRVLLAAGGKRAEELETEWKRSHESCTSTA